MEFKIKTGRKICQEVCYASPKQSKSESNENLELKAWLARSKQDKSESTRTQNFNVWLSEVKARLRG